MKRNLKGIVTSDKMEKTVVVSVETKKTHPIYRKKYVSHQKFMAHNETEAKIGDTVVIEESRPVSKNKKWNVVKVETKK
jgi:small subunit ribosomal protein S17